MPPRLVARVFARVAWLLAGLVLLVVAGGRPGSTSTLQLADASSSSEAMPASGAPRLETREHTSPEKRDPPEQTAAVVPESTRSPFVGWFDVAEADNHSVPSRRLRTPYAPRGPPLALL